MFFLVVPSVGANFSRFTIIPSADVFLAARAYNYGACSSYKRAKGST
ncbi:hypothetical protein [Capnocytophaga granulosa]|nr:hypothetical protein [Capnocytophaga granulosa]